MTPLPGLPSQGSCTPLFNGWPPRGRPWGSPPSIADIPGLSGSWGTRLGKILPLFHGQPSQDQPVPGVPFGEDMPPLPRQTGPVEPGQRKCISSSIAGLPRQARHWSPRLGKMCTILHSQPPQAGQSLWCQAREAAPPFPQLASPGQIRPWVGGLGSCAPSSSTGLPRLGQALVCQGGEAAPHHLQLASPGQSSPWSARPGKLCPLSTAYLPRPCSDMLRKLGPLVHGCPPQGRTGCVVPGLGRCTPHLGLPRPRMPGWGSSALSSMAGLPRIGSGVPGQGCCATSFMAARLGKLYPLFHDCPAQTRPGPWVP